MRVSVSMATLLAACLTQLMEFVSQFTDQEKKLMEAITEFHQKVGGDSKSEHNLNQLVRLCSLIGCSWCWFV